jgi:RHO1 GDP-GTP exchange protein 1/2
MYIRELQNSSIIPPDRLDNFINDTFYNFNELLSHHSRLVERLHEIQREEHPLIRSITAPIYDAALNFRDAYIEYIPHYPIAEYRIDEEKATNLEFSRFVDVCYHALYLFACVLKKKKITGANSTCRCTPT